MALSTSDKIKLICAFGAAILTGLIIIGIREWYAPDIRYEEGSFYISGKNAITSLNLKNYGHGDAKDIIISAHFENNINDISIEDKSLEVKTLSGGTGNKNVVIKITRIVPDYVVFIYFSIDNNQEIGTKKGFISNIIFDGGKAKTGKPFLINVLIFILSAIISSTGTGYIAYRWVGPKLFKLSSLEELVDEQGNLVLDSIICFIKSETALDSELSLNEFLAIIEKIQNDKSKSSFDKIKDLCNLCKRKNLRSDRQRENHERSGK